MTYWRMAFRWGSQGAEIWPECKKRGIAAIGYYFDDYTPIIGDCSKITEEEYDEIWREHAPKLTIPRSNLKKLAYRMTIGDVIYVKQGTSIVGHGKVTSTYQYDPRILEGTRAKWEHFVRVDWDAHFDSVPILLGSEQTTVLELSGDRLKRLQNALNSSKNERLEITIKDDLHSLIEEEKAFKEGGVTKRFVNFYERDPSLRTAAIQHSGTKCIICGFDFEAVYGSHGAGFIEVHHLRPVSTLHEPTKVDPKKDMAVVCSNCHRMIHRKSDQVLSIEEMKDLLRTKTG